MRVFFSQITTNELDLLLYTVSQTLYRSNLPPLCFFACLCTARVMASLSAHAD